VIFGQVLAFLFVLILTVGVSQKVKAQDANEPNNPAPKSEQAADEAEQTAVIASLDYMAVDIAASMHEDDYQLISIKIDAGGKREREHQIPVFVSESKKALSMGTFYLVSDVSYNGAQIHKLKSLAQEMSTLGWHSVVVPAPHLAMVMNEVDAKLAALEEEQVASTENTETENAQAGDSSNASESPDPAAEQESDSQQTDAERKEPSIPSNIQTMLAAQAHQSQYIPAYQEALSAFLGTFLSSVIKATEQPGYHVVFAQGMSAQALLDAATSNITLDALIINNVYWPERDLNRSLPMKIAQSATPLLDLVSANDNHWSKSTEQTRLVKARVEVKAHYRQREIGSVGSPSQISTDISREIYGWLSHLGW
jgi:Na+-transporting methylmalonyl-CoA/oxaloacetate decarboxylase gamma subunit